MFRRVRDSLDLLIVKFLAIVIFFYILKHFFLYNALKRARAQARKLLVLYCQSIVDQTRNKDDTNKSWFTVAE